MRIGLSTPVVVQVPGVSSEWERTATADDVAQIAAAADACGLEYLTCSEHVAIPSGEADSRGAVYWDPLATLGFLAARTRRIRLATAVLVLAYHHPMEIAKRYGTLDRISGGRLTLGVGIGSLNAEFTLLGAQWDRRADRADDAIRALRASLSSEAPQYHGPFYSYDGMTVLPHAMQQHVPIWVGGRSAGSLRRAVRFADGWMPFGLKGEQIRRMLADVDVPQGFEVVLSTSGALDPGCGPGATDEILRELCDSGATAITCSIAATSAAHYCDQVVALAAIADAGRGGS
ncbi:TIGR03619 family F420-dependent LLM class oxidoreductase [Mycolicibacterium sp. 624]|uniref:TIGR03619 family F420-dependent LLM class oxidoreductase n=1 Tax=Mycolicibacterium sp. 624 TaxID=3156314 RepID=UPI0033978ACF